MSNYRTKILVLKTRKLGEADRIILVLSEDYGKFEVVVKGARRQRSRFVGNTLPFNLLNAFFFTGRSLDQLSQAELVRSFSVIREDLVKMAYATFWVELVVEFLPERDPAPEIFRFLLAALLTLETSNLPDILNLAFQMRLLNYLGYQPELDHCANCGGSVPARPRFSVEAGGVICSQCLEGAEPRGIEIQREGLQLLKLLLVTDIRKLDGVDRTTVSLTALKNLLRYFIEARLDHPLKSQAFLESVLTK